MSDESKFVIYDSKRDNTWVGTNGDHFGNLDELIEHRCWFDTIEEARVIGWLASDTVMTLEEAIDLERMRLL